MSWWSVVRWYLFHHHHLHISLKPPSGGGSPPPPLALPGLTPNGESASMSIDLLSNHHVQGHAFVE